LFSVLFDLGSLCSLRFAGLRKALTTLENRKAGLSESNTAMAVVTTMLEERTERFVEGRKKNKPGTTSILVKILNILKAKADVAGMEQSCIALTKALVPKLPLNISTKTLKDETRNFVLESLTFALTVESFDFCLALFHWVADSKSNAVTSPQLHRHIMKTSKKLKRKTVPLLQTLNQVFPRQNFAAASSKGNPTWNKNTDVGCSLAKSTLICARTPPVTRQQLDRNRATNEENEKKAKAAFELMLHRMVVGKKEEGLKPLEDMVLNKDETMANRVTLALGLRNTKQMNRVEEKVVSMEAKVDSLIRCINGGKQKRM
jgi:hypothetical protein